MNKNNVDDKWFCPICDGKSWSSIMMVNNLKFFVCNTCSVVFIDKNRFNSLELESLNEIDKIIENIGDIVP